MKAKVGTSLKPRCQKDIHQLNCYIEALDIASQGTVGDGSVTLIGKHL